MICSIMSFRKLHEGKEGIELAAEEKKLISTKKFLSLDPAFTYRLSGCTLPPDYGGAIEKCLEGSKNSPKALRSTFIISTIMERML